VVAADPAGLAAGMAALAEGRPGAVGPRAAGRGRPRVVLVFPGQGPQWDGMGRRLAGAVPVFRDAIHRCDAAIARWTGRSLWDDHTGLAIEGTATVQPALFATQVALFETWRAWGIEPDAVIGHSMGEIAAAYASGALSLDDAAQVACERSRLLEEISGAGGLALVELAADDAAELVRGREHELSVAAVNGPRATVLSGPAAVLEDVITGLTERGVFARRIAVEFAAHGPQVEPLQPRLRAALAALRPGTAAIPLYSTVTGGPLPGSELNARYWERNVRAPVLFAPALQRLLTEGYDTFVEVAPHPVLARPIEELAGETGCPVTVISSMRRTEPELAGMLSALGTLYTAGAPVAWDALYPGAVPHTDIPHHGWEHRPFPIARVAAGGPRPAAPPTAAAGPGPLGRRIPVGVEPSLRLWSLDVDLAAAPEIADHQVDGMAVVPGAYWLTAVARAVAAERPGEPVVLADVAFAQLCPAGPAAAAEPQLAIRPEASAEASAEGSARFTVTSGPAGAIPVTHAEGWVPAAAGDAPPPLPPAAAARDLAPVPIDEHYARLAAAGLRYGPRFQGLTQLWAGGGRAVGLAQPPAGLAVPGTTAALHPALLDACLQVAAATDTAVMRAGSVPVPARIRRVWSQPGVPAPAEVWCHTQLTAASARELTCDITVTGPDGQVLWAAAGFTLRLAGPARPVEDGRLYQVRWEPLVPVPRAGGRGAGGWLVVADGAFGRAVTSRLTAAGDPCLTAVNGLALGPDEYQLPPGPSAYTEVLAEAESRFGTLRGVVDARTAGDSSDAAEDEFDPSAVAARGVDALRLAHAVVRREWPAGAPRLWVAAASGGTDGLLDAARTGLARVLANEHLEPGCTAVEIEVDAGTVGSGLDALCALLRSGEPPGQAMIRGGTLLTPVLTASVDGLAGPDTAPAAPRVRPDRTYIVSGGLGALGRRVARWLASMGARHLLLLGRGAPSRDADEDLAGLRAAGVTVQAAAVDVADARQLAGALRPGGAAPPVGGVFHLAGVLEDALVTDLTETAVMRAFAGKGIGAWNLHMLTLDQPVEFFVLFSSLAGLIGSPGQGAYAAASAFLDALARHRAAVGLPALSIDWGTWSGDGLAAGGVERLAARGVLPLDPDTGIELLGEAVTNGAAWLAAAGFSLELLHQAGAGPAARQLFAGLLPAGRPGEPSGRDLVLAAAPAERRQVLRQLLTGEVARVLGAERAAVHPNVPLQELGFDSLMAIELRNRLEAGLRIRLSATLVYAHPTISDMADALLAKVVP
ncbi:SDR family NAD(P)-dependent oxidoreductase, partial [Frankia sp. Cj3]|uniref:SDR family NAD(P)-dependent oxidoreductase n=1 Tax=Frankia sp. Cj3 TaxID=2880976 RepID=UPI001EF6E724